MDDNSVVKRVFEKILEGQSGSEVQDNKLGINIVSRTVVIVENCCLLGEL